MVAVAAPQPTGDFDRLEHRVRALLRTTRNLLDANTELRRRLGGSERRIEALESEVRLLNQGKCDVAKRIDELIAYLDQLERSAEPPLARAPEDG